MCFPIQVKRKRKEHRSLDSILFEDDAELEYFDVLNLLPLSNIRLGYDEADLSKDDNFTRKTLHGSRDLRVLEYNEPSRESEVSPTRSSNATDEEKCKEHTVKEDNPALAISSEKKGRDLNLSKGTSRRDLVKRERRKSNESLEKNAQISLTNKFVDQHILLSSSKTDQDYRKADVENLVTSYEEDRKIEEVEDYKSIWISDNEDHHEMSRRPQILKVVDNDVTKRRHRRSVVEIDAIVEDVPKDKISHSITKEANERIDVSVINLSNNVNKENKVDGKNVKDATLPENVATMEDARNFSERKKEKTGKEATRNKQNEGRFEKIVKETSNILGKACSVVKGSLGFEARSESSDLGLGSESGSDSRRRSMDDGAEDDRLSRNVDTSAAPKIGDGKKSHTNLTRSRSCVDSIECQDDGPEFDHVRYKIVKSHMFSKNMFNTARGDVTYEGLMQYLREYSFQELLMDNNVVIIEPVRAEPVELKTSTLTRTEPTCKIAGAIQKKTENRERNDEQSGSGGTGKSSRQSSIRKHFFYHPIRVNRELIDEELPDPDTVKNVRRMFENTLEKKKNASDAEFSRDCKNRRSVSMKDLTSIESRYDEMSDKAREESRSRCSSRAKDLTRLFETKSASSTASVVKEESGSLRSESKTRIIAQSFEARSGNTSPSGSNCSKNKVGRYHHHHHHHHHQNWDTGSVSSGVSSDYLDTDPGSGAHCTSSDDDDVNCNDDDADASGPGHYVSQDVLKKIREYGTSVTYYGGKVVNTHNGPLISPLNGNGFKRIDKSNDYVKFKLVKSNSCDSRLELTGRLIEGQLRRNCDRGANLRQCTIAETPSIEITTIDSRQENEEQRDEGIEQVEQMKREPPVVIGLEPKREDSKETRRTFKAEFKLGDLDDLRSNYPSKFMPSALTRWEVNTSWRVDNDFGKMEFEEFEVLEDSLNGIDGQDQCAQTS
ncbi:biorientation of chromosomes in cell division protein 1-like 1-like isoform x2 protein [Lasius niger]|uniref:Biorientation of chromosomes in cell division protein 1-like 1-like isoform x2 protein n=1 Tax=Lasius niger TaxID=67767 RepID=A0A0J7NW57_LASNI|nr:biorientation of chromosomes in cell division protein 1-like 1-like isoform x2 protein [Lasius niger]